MIPIKYTNDLLNIIIESGNDINEFHHSKNPIASSTLWVSSISVKESPLYFNLHLFGQKSFDHFFVEFTTYTPLFSKEKRTTNSGVNFLVVKNYFRAWLDNHVKPYIENQKLPDIWEAINKNPFGIENIDITNNDEFSKEEKELLIIGLNEIKGILSAQFELGENQKDRLEKKLNYLVEAVKRLNKIDWLNISISTLISISYDLALNKERTNFLWSLFSKLISIVQSLPPNMGLPPLL